MYSVLNTLSESTYFYRSKNITSYTFLLAFKIVESLQCILNARVDTLRKIVPKLKTCLEHSDSVKAEKFTKVEKETNITK